MAELPARPFGAVLTAMVTPFDCRRRPRPRRSGSGSRPTSSIAGTTAWWSRGRRGSPRPPPTPRRRRCCAPSSRRSATAPGSRRRRHQRHRAHDRARRAGREGGGARPARRHALLQQAARGRARRALHRRRRRHRPAGDGLRHPAAAPASAIGTATLLAPGGAPADRGGQGANRRPLRAARQVMAEHRPGLLLRRRRAQPRAGSRIGAAGVVSVVGHVAGGRVRGDGARRRRRRPATAPRELHHELLPAVRGIMTRTQGAIMTKAALQLQGVLPTRTDAAAARVRHGRRGRAVARADPERTCGERSGDLACRRGQRAAHEPSPPRARTAPAARPRTACASSPLGGLGEVGRNMAVLEHRGRLLDRRLRRAVPRGQPARRRPDPARTSTRSPTASTTSSPSS